MSHTHTHGCPESRSKTCRKRRFDTNVSCHTMDESRHVWRSHVTQTHTHTWVTRVTNQNQSTTQSKYECVMSHNGWVTSHDEWGTSHTHTRMTRVTDQSQPKTQRWGDMSQSGMSHVTHTYTGRLQVTDQSQSTTQKWWDMSHSRMSHVTHTYTGRLWVTDQSQSTTQRWWDMSQNGMSHVTWRMSYIAHGSHGPTPADNTEKLSFIVINESRHITNESCHTHTHMCHTHTHTYGRFESRTKAHRQRREAVFLARICAARYMTL